VSLLVEDEILDGSCHLHCVAGDFGDGVQSGCGVPGGQDEELVGGLVKEGGEACHRVVAEVEVIHQAAEQLGQDDNVVLQRIDSGDVEADGGFVAGPDTEPMVACLMGYGSEFVSQVGEERAVIGRVDDALGIRWWLAVVLKMSTSTKTEDPSSCGGSPRPTREMHRP